MLRSRRLVVRGVEGDGMNIGQEKKGGCSTKQRAQGRRRDQTVSL